MKPRPPQAAVFAAALLVLTACEAPVVGPEAGVADEEAAHLMTPDRPAPTERAAEAGAPRLPPEFRAAATKAVLAALAEWDLKADLAVRLLEEPFEEIEPAPSLRLDLRGDR